MLMRDPNELVRTDISEDVLKSLRASQVETVYIVGRRGPADTRFTFNELCELDELNDVDMSSMVAISIGLAWLLIPCLGATSRHCASGPHGPAVVRRGGSYFVSSLRRWPLPVAMPSRGCNCS